MRNATRENIPLWHKELEKYREELQAAANYQDFQKFHTLEQLMKSFSSMKISTPSTYSGVLSLHRIGPRLRFIDDFSAILALYFGADAAITAAVWGSIRLILSHAASAADTFQDVLDMLEELCLKLPRFQLYEQTLPLNRQFEQALLDIYPFKLTENIWPGETGPVRYNNITCAANSDISCGKDILEAVHRCLDPKMDTSTLKSVALFGMGGVEKTQVAIHYVHRELQTFDVILWITAENAISIRQRFRMIANKLSLLEND
ncbi:hypothetical protein E4U53_004812 [Claviceps sorghi]|nr:hypothetical protein E4U53_004812 [Claviceps sorghi]